jgi:ABC-type Co2+ transport system permease subunit
MKSTSEKPGKYNYIIIFSIAFIASWLVSGIFSNGKSYDYIPWGHNAAEHLKEVARGEFAAWASFTLLLLFFGKRISSKINEKLVLVAIFLPYFAYAFLNAIADSNWFFSPFAITLGFLSGVLPVLLFEYFERHKTETN